MPVSSHESNQGAWSILRERLSEEDLLLEFKKILDSDLYMDCTLLFLDKEGEVQQKERTKDYFDQFENYTREKQIFDGLLSQFRENITDSSKNNHLVTFKNQFDDESICDFIKLLSQLIKK